MVEIENKLKLFNTLSREKELFKPLKEGEVKMYTCGPTVYNFAHIGNLRSYLFEDVLKRVLLFNKFRVSHVMNITDVGHLSSDGDDGEDKMLKGARREKKTVWEIADFYTEAFKRDIERLNILPPNVWCKATEHIEEQLEMVKKLEDGGFTYFSGGNVYFDTSKIGDYGKLAFLNLELEGRSRVEKDHNKKNAHDFVLWFTKSKFQDQDMKWESPWGVGYPGWHIECSAMASKYLGDQFDIHCGGIDHIQVHHTNELAQAECTFGKKPWVKYWMHNEFLVLSKGEKMAKSGENFLTLSSLENKGFSALDYRYFCLGTHYKKQLMFSFEALEGARNAREKLQEHYWDLRNNVSDLLENDFSGFNFKSDEDVIDSLQKFHVDFLSQINDDLNTVQALATVWGLVKDDSINDINKLKSLELFDQVLGLSFSKIKKEVIKVPEKVLDLAKERSVARDNKNWEKSDELREAINEAGFSIKDTVDGFEVSKD